MNPDRHLMKKLPASLLFAGALTSPLVNAALIITDPPFVSGADAIDPSGTKEVGNFNASGSTSQTTLESAAGFGAIQSFGFSGNVNANQEYIFSSTDPNRSDVRLQYTGAIGTGAVSISNETFATSDASSMRISGSGTGPYGMSIQLGSRNGTAFNGGNAFGVSALGFTLTGRYGQVESVVVDYFDAFNNLLSSQTMPATNATGAGTAATYSGYQIAVGQNAIARVEITVAPLGEGSAGLFALDDLGFTAVVPEPSSGLLVIGGVAALILSRKRKD